MTFPALPFDRRVGSASTGCRSHPTRLRSSSSCRPPWVAVIVASGSLLLFSGLPGFAEDLEDSILPQPLADEHFEELLERSPFTRVLDPSETFQLMGVALIDGEQVATMVNRETKKRFQLFETPNTEGWKMVELNQNPDPAQVSATFSLAGGEVVTLKYREEQLNPAQRKTGARSLPKTPRGPDRRPLPTQEERRKFGEWVKSRMSKFSDHQKRRVGEIMQEKMKSNPNLSDRQRGEVFSQILDYVEKNEK